MIYDDIRLVCDLCQIMDEYDQVTDNSYSRLIFPDNAVDDGWEFFVRKDPLSGDSKDNGEFSLVSCPKCSHDRWSD